MAKTKYRPNFPERAYEMARSDYSNKSIAEKLGITEETFYQYIKKHSEFSDAIEKGRQDSYATRTPKVIDALYKRATGFWEGDKYYPPSDPAIFYYLGNRDASNWQSVNRDKPDDSRPQTVQFKFNIVNDDEG